MYQTRLVNTFFMESIEIVLRDLIIYSESKVIPLDIILGHFFKKIAEFPLFKDYKKYRKVRKFNQIVPNTFKIFQHFFEI